MQKKSSTRQLDSVTSSADFRKIIGKKTPDIQILRRHDCDIKPEKNSGLNGIRIHKVTSFQMAWELSQ